MNIFSRLGFTLATYAYGPIVDTPGGNAELVGSLVAGFSPAIMMSNAGGAWDNVKKYIESGGHGGKGSTAHKAAVVDDAVRDPDKDTSGPSLNILIKLRSMVSSLY